MKKVNIINFEERFATDFMKVHLEWFESDFFVENFCVDEYDRKVISQPSQYIIAKGGYVFLAKFDEKIVGTAALITRDNNAFEFSKFGVLEKYRGLKIGDELLKHAINFSKAKGKETLWLESIRVLKPALSLFQKYGFKEIALNPDSPYARADIRMALDLKN